jgi:hypothetical protein
MERIVAEGRVICDAIDACETALNENNARLTGLCHALAEQEEKVEWFREQQDKICLSNTELEEKNRELNESIKTNDGKVSRLGDRVDSTLLEENWMDRILPAGLQHGTSLGWAGNQSVVHGRGADSAEAATSNPTKPNGEPHRTPRRDTGRPQTTARKMHGSHRTRQFECSLWPGSIQLVSQGHRYHLSQAIAGDNG